VRPVDAVPPSRRPSAGAVVLAIAVPMVFPHIRYQPSVALPSHATFKLQDLAVLAVGVAAAVTARRSGIGPLRSSKWIWVTTLLFLAWIMAATFYPLLSNRPYAWRTHAVTAVEFGLYAVLAPAIPLLVRRRSDALLVLGALVAWSTAATVTGVCQWLGWNIAGAWPQGDRQPSFLGHHDFAALSGMALLAGIVGVIWAGSDVRLHRAALLAIVSGAIGFILGGASAGIVGLVPAAVIAVAIAARHHVLGRRALVATLVTVAVTSLGIVALRARDFDQFFRFAGIKQAQTSTSSNIQTYSQRTLLAYIGVRIWLDHPIAGAGWQGSTEDSAVVPTLPAAHRRFPDVAARAFPGPGHEYGIQLFYVQVLADLGLVGFVLMLGWLGTPALLGARASLRAPPSLAWIPVLGLAWLVLALGLNTAFGIVAGVPLDALAWLAVGTIAAGMAAAPPAASGRIRP
jgi:O-Antigen ligase